LFFDKSKESTNLTLLYFCCRETITVLKIKLAYVNIWCKRLLILIFTNSVRYWIWSIWQF